MKLRRWTTVIMGLIAMVVAFAWMSPNSSADTNDWSITSYDADVELTESGLATVTLNLDFDFGSEPGHGIFVYLMNRQVNGEDQDHWRQYFPTVQSVSSPSGASPFYQTELDGNAEVLKIGDENQTVTGVQSYTITYTTQGIVSPNQAASGMDELNYNIIGTGWQVPLNDVTVRVTGPGVSQKVACFEGAAYDQACSATSDGSVATYTTAHLDAGEGMQVVAGYPVGTFVGAEPTLTPRHYVGNMFPLTPLSGGLAIILTAAGVFLVMAGTRRSRRDEVYLGMAPGTRPLVGQSAATGYADSRAPVAVAFTPPRGARPGRSAS